MDFDLFLEGVSRNDIDKSTRVSQIDSGTGLDFRTRRAMRRGFDEVGPKVKTNYNRINKAIQQQSWPIKGGEYILIPPTVFKNEMFYILHKEEANKAMWALYDQAVKNPKERDDFNTLLDNLLRSSKVSAGSISVTKQKMGKFGTGYSIDMAAIARAHQGNGIMLDAYRTIVGQGVPLFSSGQSPGAIKTWIRLAETPGIKVVATDYDFKREVELEIQDGDFYYRSKLHMGDRDRDVEYILAYKDK